MKEECFDLDLYTWKKIDPSDEVSTHLARLSHASQCHVPQVSSVVHKQSKQEAIYSGKLMHKTDVPCAGRTQAHWNDAERGG